MSMAWNGTKDELTQFDRSRETEARVATRWFTRRQIARALGISTPEAISYCDHATDRATDGSATKRVFDGGYGANIIDKVSSTDFDARKAARTKLSGLVDR